jgi:uncharacterized protein YerC
MRIASKKINAVLDRQIKKTFIQLISDISKPQEAEIFLKDFFTGLEHDIFSKRLAVAYWLKNKRTYSNIKQNLKVSTATISAIRKMMQKEGFKLALKKVDADEWAEKWSKRLEKFIGKK